MAIKLWDLYLISKVVLYVSVLSGVLDGESGLALLFTYIQCIMNLQVAFNFSDFFVTINCYYPQQSIVVSPHYDV